MKFEIFKKKSKYLLFTLFVLTLLTIASCSSNQGPGKYDTFAKALTEEGVKM